MTKSSAYKSKFNFVPFGSTKGSDKVFSKENGMSLIKRLNSNGLKMQLGVFVLRVERVVFDFVQFLRNM